MKNLLQKNSLPYVVMGLLFTSMGLLVWFGIIPFRTFIVEKANSIQQLHTERESRERQLNQLPELEKQFQNILANENVLNVLLSEDKIVDFVKILEELAVTSQVEILIESKESTVIQEKKVVPKAKAKKTTAQGTEEEPEVAAKKTVPTILESLPYDRYLWLNIIVRGEYRNIVTFLHKLENLPFALDVVGMTVKIREVDEERGSAPIGRNPFLLTPELNFLSTDTTVPDTAKKVLSSGKLEAQFDTAVYLLKKE